MDYVEQLRTNGELMSVAAERDLEELGSHVPSCPDWNVGKLVTHTGMHHRWVADAVRREGEAPPNPVKPGLRGTELIEWFRSGWSDLADLLSSKEDGEPAWSWSGDNRVGFWRRRTSLETLVHRWDCENATGETSPLDAELAADGVDEMLFVMIPDGDASYRGISGRVRLVASDVSRAWTLQLGNGDPVQVERADGDRSRGDLTLETHASDLLLYVWGRKGTDAMVLDGDPELSKSFAAWIEN